MSSFVLTLSMAQAGGALEVFDCRCEPGDARMISADGAVRPRLDDLASVAFRVPAGDMIIVDSGRYLHRVTPVVGASRRWTACSFIARAAHLGYWDPPPPPGATSAPGEQSAQRFALA
jgi:hypothetical protein